MAKSGCRSADAHLTRLPAQHIDDLHADGIGERLADTAQRRHGGRRQLDLDVAQQPVPRARRGSKSSTGTFTNVNVAGSPTITNIELQSSRYRTEEVSTLARSRKGVPAWPRPGWRGASVSESVGRLRPLGADIECSVRSSAAGSRVGGRRARDLDRVKRLVHEVPAEMITRAAPESDDHRCQHGAAKHEQGQEQIGLPSAPALPGRSGSSWRAVILFRPPRIPCVLEPR